MGSCDLTVPRYIMNNISLVLWLLLVSARGQEQVKQCKEQEFAQTRNNYELCASRKIGEITSWLQKEEQEGQEEKEEGLIAVCRAVRQLIHDCGNALSYCFTTEQVEETKEKQRSGLRTILAKHYTPANMDRCFLKHPEVEQESSTDTEIVTTATTEVTTAITTAITTAQPVTDPATTAKLEETHEPRTHSVVVVRGDTSSVTTPTTTTTTTITNNASETTSKTTITTAKTTSTSANISTLKTRKHFSNFDEGTTPSPVEPFKC